MGFVVSDFWLKFWGSIFWLRFWVGDFGVIAKGLELWG